MKFKLFTLLILISELSFGQLTGDIKDSITNNPIPYVNIWIENKNTGTTADEQGRFRITTPTDSNILVFSSVGYKTKRLKCTSHLSNIKLQPEIVELSVVVVTNHKKKKTCEIEKFKKSEIKAFFSCGSFPWIVAQYFPFKNEYKETPLLKSITILTQSNIDNSKFNVRLYSVNEKGEPGDYIYNENIFGRARKGTNFTTINLSSYNIIFPNKGFFIALEWLLIDDNKYEFKYKENGITKKYISYEPWFGTLPKETNENSWIKLSEWEKRSVHFNQLKQYKDKYSLVAIELTLSN